MMPLLNSHPNDVLFLLKLSPPSLPAIALYFSPRALIEDVFLHVMLNSDVESSALIVRRAVVWQKSLPLTKCAKQN